MIEAFEEFGVPRSFLPLEVESFLKPQHNGFNVGREPACIDIHNSILGLSIFGLSEFELTIKQVHGVDALCLTVEELVRSKKAAGRPQDLADIRNLLQT